MWWGRESAPALPGCKPFIGEQVTKVSSTCPFHQGQHVFSMYLVPRVLFLDAIEIKEIQGMEPVLKTFSSLFG